MRINIEQKLLKANTCHAAKVRELLKKHKIFMVNIIGSPGCGKTSLLEQTIPQLIPNHKVAIIEGDVATARDAERLQQFGAPVVMINTGGGCHLSAVSVDKAVSELDLSDLDLILVENVGNLVCPSHFDLGEDAKVAVSSVPEGDDKPSKYPMLFREASLTILNKIDLLPCPTFDLQAFRNEIKNLNTESQLLEVSCIEGEKITDWISWLSNRRGKKISGL